MMGPIKGHSLDPIFSKKESIKATFCVGNNILKEPEIFKQLIDDGHSIGNHLMNHENGFKQETKIIFLQLEQAKISRTSLFDLHMEK